MRWLHDDGSVRSFSLVMAGHAAAGAVLGVTVATATLAIDHWLAPPAVFPVGNAHALLVALVGAVLTIAVFTLWMRTVVVGLTSGQVSPRITSGYLDDAFQRRVTGWMVGALVYLATVVLRFPEDGTGEVAPLVSILLSGVIAVAALVALLVAMRHAVTSLSPPEVVRHLADQAFARLQLPRWPDDPPGHDDTDRRASTPVRSRTLGWVRDIDHRAILEELPEGGVAILHVTVGDFVAAGDVLVAVSTDDTERVEAVRRAITLGRARKTQRDVAYAIQQLVDVVEHATAPSAHDTTTAVEALAHLRAVLAELIRRGTGTGCLHGDGDRQVLSRAVHSPLDHLREVTERLRGASADPVVARTVRRTLELLEDTARETGDDRSATFLREERRKLEESPGRPEPATDPPA